MYCYKCGAQIPEGNAFCTGCGEAVQKPQSTQNNNSSQGSCSSSQNFSGADFTASFERADIEANKVVALFSYLGILFFVPLVAAPNSKYARFHANQGLILFLLWAICGAASLPFHIISWFGFFNPFNFLHIIPIILMVLGIINAVSGKAAELPIIGKFRIFT